MTNSLDGKVAQGWGGIAPNGVHVNVALAQRGSPTAAAMTTVLTAPSAGFTPILVCLGPDQPSYETVYPPTWMLNKMPADNERVQNLVAGAGQVGIGQGILDAVAENLLEADQETIVFVSIWVDGAANSGASVRDATREATLAAVSEAVKGRNPEAIGKLVAKRDDVTHPFYVP